MQKVLLLITSVNSIGCIKVRHDVQTEPNQLACRKVLLLITSGNSIGCIKVGTVGRQSPLSWHAGSAASDRLSQLHRLHQGEAWCTDTVQLVGMQPLTCLGTLPLIA